MPGLKVENTERDLIEIHL